MRFCSQREDGPQLLKQTIEQRLGVQVYLVDETPMPGLYLLGTARGLLYSDARGDHVLQGLHAGSGPRHERTSPARASSSNAGWRSPR